MAADFGEARALLEEVTGVRTPDDVLRGNLHQVLHWKVIVIAK